MTGNYKVAKVTRSHKASSKGWRAPIIWWPVALKKTEQPARNPQRRRFWLALREYYSVFRVNFMVKLLRACVWMPWRKKAMKDVASCDKPRGDASNL